MAMLTVDEAVAWIMQALTLEYRKKCLREWREKFGDAYANEIEFKVKRNWKGKK